MAVVGIDFGSLHSKVRTRKPTKVAADHNTGIYRSVLPDFAVSTLSSTKSLTEPLRTYSLPLIAFVEIIST